jgi:hypothetical protein
VSKSFVFDRFDVVAPGGYFVLHEKEVRADGDYVKAQDAIDRDEVLKAQIRVLEIQLKELRICYEYARKYEPSYK